MEILKIIILSISGLLLFAVGAMRLSNPIKTYLKNSGIQLENDTQLLNEIRGISALMMFGGLLILSGILLPTFTFTSFVIASLIFVGFAIGRILSYSLDGKPNKLIIQGLISELVLGAANIFCVISSLMH